MTIRVLIVDDQALIRTGIATLLSRKADIEVVGQAGNGREALELVASLDPDVVLMDVMMPVMDGVEATRKLAERGPRPAVIMLTTFHDDERVLQSIAAGARGYLLKDVDHRVLADSIRTVAGGGALIHPQIIAQLLPRLASLAPTPVTASSSPSDVTSILTPRERDILRLLAQGYTNQEIGEQLALSVGTVKNHLSVIFAKLAVRDRTQAALWAREHLL
ncbi:MAG: DNA-binding response regulator [Chloroflexus sp.]|jgi:DNA-binding NarL/FixJ family response regulator|uniref:Response regulator receiver n=1 Tax=Chloroflexus aurantiacus (strain ATCC 29366 / DSM 635 / J-10-fl) TaxID=324602 RepID=A9WA66_CHLAA|nr:MULTISPECIES: response regulator transcription factor [Chloroflexus]RMG51771.1 MAG: DNA-binding response regulator [Chloroflexota bacterium]ABY34625.1 response regulator receiver [Chloroflexus aurantiacus J-10-fl]GIV87172.1 MAG: DNA-binding response regulator [Chloroflexus sp.]GIV93871.1 MAG: DNA-binding response regulator [Chloroflexus sp.]HBW68845.1 DNA-binding response regulator [Chloroflexus aurantiacus]